MKVFILILALILGSSGIALANPFLVCDPVAENLTNYVVMQDGVKYDSIPKDLGNGTVRLQYDLGGLSIGEHHFEVAAENEWGRSDFAPFDCTKSLPGAPSGLRLEK